MKTYVNVYSNMPVFQYTRPFGTIVTKNIKFPPAFRREDFEAVEFVPEEKNLVLYGPVGIGKHIWR